MRSSSSAADTIREAEFNAKAEEAIPSEVWYSRDITIGTQTSADVQDVATFQLPDAAGKLMFIFCNVQYDLYHILQIR